MNEDAKFILDVLYRSRISLDEFTDMVNLKQYSLTFNMTISYKEAFFIVIQKMRGFRILKFDGCLGNECVQKENCIRFLLYLYVKNIKSDDHCMEPPEDTANCKMFKNKEEEELDVDRLLITQKIMNEKVNKYNVANIAENESLHLTKAIRILESNFEYLKNSIRNNYNTDDENFFVAHNKMATMEKIINYAKEQHKSYQAELITLFMLKEGDDFFE